MAKSKKIEKLKFTGNFSIVDGDIQIKVDCGRFYDQFKQAQYELDSNVMNGMEKFMPKDTNNFVQLTRQESAALAGSGEVVAGHAPYGRFLYYGKVMVDPLTGSPFARAGAKKIVKIPEVDLNFSNPSAVPRWFEEAKKQFGDQWIKKVKETAGGG